MDLAYWIFINQNLTRSTFVLRNHHFLEVQVILIAKDSISWFILDFFFLVNLIEVVLSWNVLSHFEKSKDD